MANGEVLMENAKIVFRNFAGKEGMYNREGDRNFCVLLDQDLAEKLHADGWNVKALKSREPDDPPQPYIQVTVSYKGRPPRVVMITSKGRNDLTEEEIEVLDWVDLVNVDLIFRPYAWQVRDASGIKAYLKSIYLTIYEDELELKYADLEDLNELPARAGKIDE